MSTAENKAVFLSYASQDAEAAKRICEALRTAGVEVWFDAEGGLEHGDEWDAKIRRQIKECVLFIAVISANTQARDEGYFRIEWDLAAERARGIASGVAFILPIVIDDTREPDALVPDRFRAVQWTRLRGGEVTPEVKQRLLKLWSHRAGAVKHQAREQGSSSAKATEDRAESREQSALPVAARPGGAAGLRGLGIGVLVVLAVLAAYFIFKPRRSPEEVMRLIAEAQTIAANATKAATVATPPASEAQRLVARVWELLDKPDLGRAELGAADDLCKQAAALAPVDADVAAAWSQVDSWAVYLGFDASLARREAARAKAERALQFAPKSFEARLARACYLLRARSNGGISQPSPETEPILRGLLQEHPAEPRTLLALAICLRDQQRTAEAQAALGELARNPAFAAQAWNEIGWAALFARDIPAAEAAADKSIALQPCWPSLSLKLQIVLFIGGDLAEARAALGKLSDAALQEDYGAMLACWVYTYRREWDNGLHVIAGVSREWLHTTLADGPRSAFIGLLHHYAGRDTLAEVEWRAALKLIEQRLAETPNDPALLRWKGTLLVWLGDPVGGEKLLRLGRALLGLASAEDEGFERLQLGRLDEAVDCFERATVGGVLSDWFTTAASFRFDPRFDPLRTLPRFQALRARLDVDPLRSPAARQRPAAGASSPSSLSLTPSNPPEVDSKSVAVLAFANLSDDKGNEYFSDGISEELLNVLAKVPGLKVTARTSSFFFKGREVPVPEIAQKLGVAYVVEGSVRKSGNQVRITAQLIKAADGFHVWSDTFTRDLKDIFAVQDEIAGLIAQNLEMKMGVVAAVQTVDPEAYRLYLEALPAITLRTWEGYDRAEQLLTRAVERDPGLIPAQAALAVVWSMRAQEKQNIGSADSPLAKRIVAQAEMAVRLGPGWAEAQAACGLIYSLTLRFAEAEQFLRQAVQINPSYAPAHLWLGRILLSTGRMDEALAELKHAAELDPLSHRALDNYAFALMDAGQPKAALGFVERALQLQAGSGQALEVKADLLAQTGRLAEALAIVNPKRAESIGDLEYTIDVYFLAGWRPELEALLTATPGIRRLDRFYTLAALGRNEEALAELESTAVDWGFLDLLLFSPVLDPIRHESRFQAKLQSSGFAEFHARAQAWRAAHPPEKPAAKQ